MLSHRFRVIPLLHFITSIVVVVVVVFYCPYTQSINCGEDISVETD